MELFRGYTTSDALFDEPFINGTIKIYPIKVREYKEFTQYVNYFLFSRQHYGIDNKINLFEYTLAVNISRKQKEAMDKKKQMNNTEGLMTIVDELSRAFTILCREEMKVDLSHLRDTGDVKFHNENNTICIHKGNFEMVRQIVLKQNFITEPKIFEDEIERKLAEKYLKAQSKNNKGISGLGEIANLVSCTTGKTYETLYNQNVMQLYADFYRCINTENFKTTSLFRTVDTKVNVVNYAQEVVSLLYKDAYEGMWKDRQQIFG